MNDEHDGSGIIGKPELTTRIGLFGDTTGVSSRYSLTLGGPKLGYTAVITPIWSYAEFPRMGL